MNLVSSLYPVNINNYKNNYNENNHLTSKNTVSSGNSKVSFGNYYQYTPIYNYFNAREFLNSLRYENAEKKYITFSEGKADEPLTYESETIGPNKRAIEKLKVLDSLTLRQKASFVDEYCKMTGFPDLRLVSENINNEILDGIHSLADKYDFDVKFVGYDINSSVGRDIALPGSDCDGLYMIIDPKDNKEDYFPGSIRWKFKDVINQRILSTPANGLPEVLSVDYIKEGLDLALDAFNKSHFTDEQLTRFENNLDDNTNNFVKSAEFNIILTRFIPQDVQTRDKYYKTAMFVELLRDGKILENSFDKTFINKIKNHPLYKYSNIMKQQGLKDKPKNKHLKRMNELASFKESSIERQFSIIKEILYSSFKAKCPDAENSSLFENTSEDGRDEMGNILRMYDLLMNKPCLY